jgi:hypothetical protein
VRVNILSAAFISFLFGITSSRDYESPLFPWRDIYRCGSLPLTAMRVNFAFGLNEVSVLFRHNKYEKEKRINSVHGEAASFRRPTAHKAGFSKKISVRVPFDHDLVTIRTVKHG